MRSDDCGHGREWTVDELISIAQSFDHAARRAKPDLRSSYRGMAFGARKYARYKVMNDG